MGERRTRGKADARNTISQNHLDSRDQEILRLLLLGEKNRKIATKLKIPMSTVQRRTRKLLHSGTVRIKYELNYKRLGFRTGLLHVYLKDGNIQGIADAISKIKGMQSTSVHIGNSDIVGLFVFQETQHLLDILSNCKKIEGVERVVWSEEVMRVSESSGTDIDEQLVAQKA
jgi:DNA-binding Lrp family transcriptional regulator